MHVHGSNELSLHRTPTEEELVAQDDDEGDDELDVRRVTERQSRLLTPRFFIEAAFLTRLFFLVAHHNQKKQINNRDTTVFIPRLSLMKRVRVFE